MGRTAGYRRRLIDDLLDVLTAELPAVSIDGAKAVGKTATATQRVQHVYALDDPATRAAVEADPTRLFQGAEPILIDEWQRLPATWDMVRRAVDGGAGAGRFFLTGSASIATGTHSGAGWIVPVRLRPLTLAERVREAPTVSLAALLGGARGAVDGETNMDLAAYTEEIVRSGFPGLRSLGERALRAQLDAYLTRIVDRDVPELGPRTRDPGGLRRWLAAYGAATSTVASFETIRAAATGGHDRTPARSTVQPYREALERLFILDPVAPWLPTRSHINELASPAKHHLVDPSLAARLVGATSRALLDGEGPATMTPKDGTFLGALFESMVTQSVRVYAQVAGAEVRHFRTHRGEHEVDLVVERDDGRVVAIEVKLGSVPGAADVRHLHWLADQIGDDLLDAIVVTTGREAFRRPDGIAVVPAALLGP